MRRILSALFLALILTPVCSLAQQKRTANTKSRTSAGAGQSKAAKTAQSGAQTEPQAGASASSSVKDEGCACDAAPDVLALVNGVEIKLKDIDTPDNKLEEQRKQLEAQIVEARKRELNLQINAKLFEAEAKKRGITVTKLLEQEVKPKVAEPTEKEAEFFYDSNRAQIQGEYSEVRNSIISHLRSQRQQEQEQLFADRLRASHAVKVLVSDVTPPASAADRARVFATVNGQKITSGDIEESLRPFIFDVKEQIYQSRKQALDMKINDMLLEEAAKKRNTTTSELFRTEVLAKTKQVTDQDAQAFYNENKERIKGDFNQLKPQIIQYLQQNEESKAQSAFAEQLRKGASVKILLLPPEPPIFEIPIDDQPIKGNPNAKVTLVEFTDYECPSCAQTQPVIERLAKEYGDRIRIVARDYPLGQHAHAFKAAEAAEAAREQGKYWEYISMLFSNQTALQVDKLKEYATKLGLDRQKFDAALDSGKFAEKVRRDLQDGNRFGVSGTPTVFVNGRRVADKTYEGLKASIEDALKATAQK